MELNFTNIVIMVAAAQAFLLHLLIFQKHRSLFANKYLAILMLCYTGTLVHLLLQDAGLYVKVPYLFILSALPLIAMPLHYLYTKHLINLTRQFQINDLFHFIPAVIYSAILVIVIPSLIKDFANAGNVSGTPFLFAAYNVIIIAEGFIYMGLSVRLINLYNTKMKNVVSTVDALQLTWLKNITYAGITAIIVFMTEEIFLVEGINISNFVLSSIFFALYVYGIGYGGLLKSEVFKEGTEVNKLAEAIEVETPKVKYEKSSLTESEIEKIKNDLLLLMSEKKCYLNSNLTLAQLAKELSISTHNLSEVINKSFSKNFYDFINAYRVEEFKERIKNPNFSNYSLLAIAFESGFSSKSSFNSVFKKFTNVTPSEYKKSIS